MTDACPSADSMDLLSRRHALPILWALSERSPLRFVEIKRLLEINAVTLSERLADLEAAGIVSRTSYDEVPPRVDYALTEKGHDLLPILQAIESWDAKYHARA